MAKTETSLSLDHGDIINLSALVHNTLAIHQVWREVVPILAAHSPQLAAKLIDRFVDNVFVASRFRDRHRETFDQAQAFSKRLFERAVIEEKSDSAAHAKAAEFVEQMNALAQGLLEGGAE